MILNKFKSFLNSFKPRLKRAAVFIINYNMPIEADNIFRYLKKNINYPCDINLIDNASDLKKPAKNTNIFLNKNLQMTNGILAGMKKIIWLPFKYYSYTFISTSAKMTKKTGDFITKANELFLSDFEIVGYHPALSLDSIKIFKRMAKHPGTNLRKASFLETVCVTYRAFWFDDIGRFDPHFIYGWGMDLETGYFARLQNKKMYIDDKHIIKKDGGIGYRKNRMNMNLKNKENLALKNMVEVFLEKYGTNWSEVIHNGVSLDEVETLKRKKI